MVDSIITTVCKARLRIADIDRQYYQSHQLTLAQQSSENVCKSMMRIVAYIYNANEALTIRKQQWNDTEPELMEQSLDDKIQLWVDLGQPNVKRVKKACKLSQKVIIYTYNRKQSEAWWEKNKHKLNHFKNLSIYSINSDDFERLNNKRMNLDCTLQDGDLQINDGTMNLVVEREKLM